MRAGEVLCRYEVEKKQAIEREDYDAAKLNKVGIRYTYVHFVLVMSEYCVHQSYSLVWVEREREGGAFGIGGKVCLVIR